MFILLNDGSDRYFFDLSLAIVFRGLSGLPVFSLRKSAVITINVEEVDWSRMGLVPTDCTEKLGGSLFEWPVIFFMSSERLKQTLLQLETKSGVVFFNARSS